MTTIEEFLNDGGNGLRDDERPSYAEVRAICRRDAFGQLRYDAEVYYYTKESDRWANETTLHVGLDREGLTALLTPVETWTADERWLEE